MQGTTDLFRNSYLGSYFESLSVFLGCHSSGVCPTPDVNMLANQTHVVRFTPTFSPMKTDAVSDEDMTPTYENQGYGQDSLVPGHILPCDSQMLL